MVRLLTVAATAVLATLQYTVQAIDLKEVDPETIDGKTKGAL
jgi:hypothetical protein